MSASLLDPASVFALCFVVLLLFGTALKLFLMQRQRNHVRHHRDQVPAAFAASIGLSAHQRAADYTCARIRLARLELVALAVFVVLLTVGGGLQYLHEGWSRLLPAGSISHGLALLVSLALLNGLLELPFSLRRIFGIEQTFGFNRITPALFVADTLRSIALGALIGLPLLALLLWLMTMSGHWWWLWAWALWLSFNVLAMLIWPTFIAPLFNRFTPLADDQLRTRVEALLARCGFRSQGLFVMDGSRRSAHGNAYFTGFGNSKRIVFFDTLLERLDGSEIEAVLAHELGHFHHRHLSKRLAVIAPVSLALLALLGWLSLQEWFFAGLGSNASDPAMLLALITLALPVFTFPLTPVLSHWSRANEFEADAFAARQTRAADLVSALVKLYRDNASTLTPDPLYSRFYDSHPPAAIRIAHLEALSS